MRLMDNSCPMCQILRLGSGSALAISGVLYRELRVERGTRGEEDIGEGLFNDNSKIAPDLIVQNSDHHVTIPAHSNWSMVAPPPSRYLGSRAEYDPLMRTRSHDTIYSGSSPIHVERCYLTLQLDWGIMREQVTTHLDESHQALCFSRGQTSITNYRQHGDYLSVQPVGIARFPVRRHKFPMNP